MELSSECDESNNSEDTHPTEETLRDLIHFASKIRNIEPWKQFRDEDIFGIGDPESGKLLIVSILGKAKCAYAFQLYLGEEGLDFWTQRTEGVPMESNDAYKLRMIDCAFVNKSELDAPDMALFQRYGKVSRKKNSWPFFRSFRPALYPWVLEDWEGRLLTRAMRLFLHFQEELEFLLAGSSEYPMIDGRPAIPVLRLNRGGNPDDPGDWERKEEAIPFPEPEPMPNASDEEFVEALSKYPVKGDVWEVDTLFLSSAVHEGARPFFPKVSLAVTEDGAVSTEPPPYGGNGNSAQTEMEAVREAILNLAATFEILPKKIRVVSERADNALEILNQVGAVQVRAERQEILPFVAEQILGMVENGPESMLDEFDDFGTDEPGERTELPTLIGEERYTFRVELTGCKPPIWRRISMPADATFFHLHSAIQDIMDWDMCHLYDFMIGKGRSAKMIGPTGEEGIDSETTLKSILGTRVKEFEYIYDYGDSWLHLIKVEKLEEMKKPDPNPRCHAGKRVAPPEDCGGIWGFMEILGGTSEWCDEMDPEYLEFLRNGTFNPKEIQFRDPCLPQEIDLDL